MMRLPLFRRALSDSWRSLLGWSIGILAALLLYLPLFPAIGGNADMRKLLDSLPPELVKTIGYEQIATGTGYTQSTFFGLMGFVLFTIAATAWGTAAIAGDEESGSLELTLAHGVGRTQLVLERAAALLTRLGALAVVATIAILALNGPSGLDIHPAHIPAAAAALLGLTLLSGMAALCVGALTGRRSHATVAGAGIAVVSYALNAVANQGQDLGWLHGWSPYHWAFGGSPLVNGVGGAGGSLWLNYAVSAVLLVIAVIALNRRDLKN
ncbi:ABC-2 type transport system permease protein [Homoserinimonas aerilata]|uniref:ABC-2 type transport system permease protein n=1 Tax=Homoserinimonas aerilata TaxID=1162970 RepID=A0A542YH39_9MICO|nr:ABC transporter permease subunit [Homoserinimonas aerilata]TQL47376.1 ABC-2 type transport system permease protein [Homoserinimonas aerilata]